MKPCLAVMCKRPQHGRVKTRIAAALGDDIATELYRCALVDTLALASSIEGVSHALSYAPPTPDSRRYFEQVAPAFALIPQHGGTLGERITGTLATLLTNYSPVVLIGSDSPDLPAEMITRAFDALRNSADVVLGPATDGGYCLVGLNVMHSNLFACISWSTVLVAQQTRERAVEAGLHVVNLPIWHDLDTVEDLGAIVAPGAPRTRAFVATLKTKEIDENESGGCLESR
ncbi:MAG TPA: TIGR04282 family arsenosugar biosynthesis glycosyltransferase [Burkholderiaceae bacterium]|nr:TIGR04282 family arsenosugar biosynthesis glycosyltransferase [Burkholderiaceae bacterium]